MAHCLDAAIKDFLYTMKHGIDGVAVDTEVKPLPNKTQLIVSAGDIEEERGFGQVRITQSIDLTLNIVKGKSKADQVSLICNQINKLMTVDSKRGGYAATTVPDSWTKEEDDGRNLIVMSSSPTIQVVETRLC